MLAPVRQQRQEPTARSSMAGVRCSTGIDDSGGPLEPSPRSIRAAHSAASWLLTVRCAMRIMSRMCCL